MWGLNGIDDKSQGVWAGGTDMLRRAVDYILQDDDPEVPVKDGVAWSNNPQKIATLSGKIRAVRPIDLGGDGKLLLFVARRGRSLAGLRRQDQEIHGTSPLPAAWRPSLRPLPGAISPATAGWT